jgi:hypothetical protein
MTAPLPAKAKKIEETDEIKTIKSKMAVAAANHARTVQQQMKVVECGLPPPLATRSLLLILVVCAGCCTPSTGG